MGDQGAVTSLVQEGDIWRVQIIWPNGEKNFVGDFASESDATKWINGHSWWLVEADKEAPASEPSKPSTAA